MNYYKAVLRGVQAQDEQYLDQQFLYINVPVLAIGGLRDLVARSDQIEATFEPWAKAGLTLRYLDTGHWIMHEDPDGVNAALLELLAL